jgi:CRISPR/Cas system-associated exonuclease Cas4 (RecB family)
VARPKMPDGLYISVSQVKQFLMCPKKYELHYILREEPAFVPVALAFGSAFHEALAAYYGEIKATGELLRRDLVLDVFRNAWTRAVEGPVPLQPEEDEDGAGTDQVIDKGVSMLHAFCENVGKSVIPEVESVELSFAVPIRDMVTGEQFEEQLVGAVDLVLREDGRQVIVEHKTAAKKYGLDQIRYDLQPTAYKLAARELGLGDVALRYQVITKTKVPAIQIADLHRDEQDEQDFLLTVGGVLRAIDAGVSYPLRGWQCRSCPYGHACSQASGFLSCAA